jgi:acyl-CoA synthetase (AMP-forming)/AMP-acid ligase II
VSTESVATFPELLEAHARARPDAIVYTWLGEGESPLEELTFGELRRQARSVAAGLSGLARPGQRALIVVPQGLQFLVTFFACLYASVIPVPVTVPNRRRGLEIVSAIANDAGALWLLSSETMLQQLLEGNSAASLGALLPLDVAALQISPEQFRPHEVEPKQIALLQYTSGSTRAPRGVAITHENLAANQQQVAACLASDRSTVYVSWLPMFHDMGLGLALQAVWVGVRCILMSPRAFFQEPLRWLRVISHYKATTSGGPNSAFALCVQRAAAEQVAGLDLSRWRVAFNGSEPVHAATLERFARAFAAVGFDERALHPVYGLAESTLLAASEPPAQGALVRHVSARALAEDRANDEDGPSSGPTRPLVSCGGPWPGSEIALVEPGTSREATPGRTGEIWIRGPSVAPGYWNRPDETAATFGLALEDGRRGFVRSGDLGVLIEGRLFVLGRQSDALHVEGRRHYAHDLELTASSCHDGLAPSACAAVWGGPDVDGLVLILEVARSALRRLPASEVTVAVREALMAHHQLDVQGVVLIKPATLPRTTSGKVRRARARLGLLEGSLAVLHTWFAPSSARRMEGP